MLFRSVLAGKKAGRRSDQQITLFDSVGFAIEDFSALRYIRDQLARTGYYENLDMLADPDEPRDLYGMILRAAKQHVVRPFQSEVGNIGQEVGHRFRHRHPGEQGNLRGLARRHVRSQQHRQSQIVGRCVPGTATAATPIGLSMREHRQAGWLPTRGQRPAKIGGGRQNLVYLQPPVHSGSRVHPKIALAAAKAAASTGAANRKNPVVNKPPTTATKDSDAGRASKASALSSKNITLMMRI